jgi:hypothetical protein
MKLSEKKGGDFVPHPQTEGPVKAVIVDVTPLKKQQSQYGEREVFRLVYETEVKDADGRPCYIWSRGYTPSLNEKANFRKDVKKILGRDLTAAELDEFDVECLIGMGVKLIVEHEQGERDGNTYAVISFIGAEKDKPLKASGKYTRVKDRDEKQTDSRPAAKAPTQSSDDSILAPDWQSVVVHIGKHKGKRLGDVDEEGVELLIQKWLPTALKSRNPEDEALITALTEVQALLTADY